MTTADLLTFVLGGARAYRPGDHTAPEPRRFRLPWSVEDRASCFVVKDRAGQELAYIYYEDDPRRRSIVKLLSRDEARSIAAAIARLPKMVS
jgi:hypothetical protein